MKLLWRLLGLSHGVRIRLLLAAVIALVVLAANIALLTVAGWFITAMAAAGLAGTLINYFTPAAAIRGFAIVRSIGRYLERWMSHDATLRLLTRLRGQVYRRLEPLAPAVLETYRKGDLLARLVGDVDTLDNAYLRIAIPTMVALSATLGSVAVLAFSAPILIPVDIGLLAITGVALPVVAGMLGREPGAKAMETSGELKAEVLDGLEGLSELTVLGATEAKRDVVARLDRRLNTAQRMALRIDAAMLAISTFVSGAAIWLTFLILEPATVNGHIGPLALPMLVFFVLASGEIVQALPAAFRALGETTASARRIFGVMSEKPPVVEPPHSAKQPTQYDLLFRNVGLTYPTKTDPALSGLNFELPEGASLAIVGPSGAGKSSVIQILLRFREYQEGDIRLGGSSLRHYASEEVRRCVGYVAQSSRLFSTTLRENLRLGRPQASDSEMWDVLEMARVADEIAAMPEGLGTFVGTGGINPSVGQTRRIMLARALLRKAPILLLDEPTEGLDTINERALLQTLVSRQVPSSLLIITHRLTGLESMDQIIVLDRGRVVQRGTHNDLITRPGLYQTMATYFTG